MTKIFIHGNPETTSVWDALLPELSARGVDDIVLLSPPGFGAPLPDRFGSTAPEYRDWLIAELEAFGSPVDVVGHDWGAGHVYAVAAERPDLLRTWIADCCGIIHPDYVWHPAAQAWQTPGDGEALIAEMVEFDAQQFIDISGVPPALAPSIAEHFDDFMGESILSVYRSAAQPYMRNLGEKLSKAPRTRSLIVLATEDPYTNPEFTSEVASMVGASGVLRLEGTGHWWMYQEPAAAADAFVDFWAKS